MSAVDWALRYAERGWRVFPVWWMIDQTRCACDLVGCMSGKHPIGKLAPRGFLDATTDRAIITRWWQEYPSANIGIATGEISGISVLDIDPRNGGYFNSQFPPTLKIRTGGGGIHLYYKYKKGLPKTMGTGFDIKSDGGYVVAPPSNHALGVYVLDSEIELDEFPAVPKAAIPHRGGGIETGHERARVQTAIAFVKPDERDTWLAVGMALHSSGWGDAYDIWGAWSRQSAKYDAKDQTRVWASFKGGGTGFGTLFHLAKAGGWHLVPDDESPPLEVYAEYDIPALTDEETDETGLYINPPAPTTGMLYGLAGDVGKTAANNTEACEYAATAGFLSFLSASIGRDMYLPVGNTWHHGRLYMLHVGRSGRGRKGEALSLTHRIRYQLPKELGCRVHTGGLSSSEGLINMIHDGYQIGKKIVPPIPDKRLWIVENEFCNVLHQGKREGNTLSSALRNAWDGQTLYPAVKHAPISAKDPHIAMAAAITPGELLDVIGARELTNGFAGRIIIFWSERTKTCPFPRSASEREVEQLAERTAKVIQFARGDYPMVNNSRRMSLDGDAVKLYTSLYAELNSSLEGMEESIIAMLERRAIMLLRMAKLFAITDLETVVNTRHIESAYAWVQYWEASVRFIFGERTSVNPWQSGDETAKKIVEWLKRNKQGITKNGIRDLFGRHLSAREISKSIEALERTGIVRNKIIATRGRSKTVYILS